MSKSVSLPSGSELVINIAPFDDAKSLYQAILEEVKGLKLDPEANVDVNLFKDMFCAGFASKKIEVCLWKCMDRSLIDKLKISKDTFEPEDKRQDYMTVCIEVAKENVLPFTKNLMQSYKDILGVLTQSPA